MCKVLQGETFKVLQDDKRAIFSAASMASEAGNWLRFRVGGTPEAPNINDLVA